MNGWPTGRQGLPRSTAAVLALAAVVLTVGSGAAPASTSTYRADVLSDSPAGYWRVGEASGGTVAADETGTNPGAYQNGVTLGQTGALLADADTAASFDGVNDIVSVPHSSSLNATSGVTIEAWVKRTRTGAWQNILAKPGNGAAASQNYALWLNTSNQPVAIFGNGSSSVSAYAPAIDTNWHHIVATYDEATAKVYIDGVLRVSTNSTVQLTGNSQPLVIGRTTDNLRIFGGTLDEVAVYPSALSAARIQAHYTAATSVDTTPPQVTLTAPANGSVVGPTPTFAGQAGTAAGDEASVTVKIYAGATVAGSPVQTLTATPNGTGAYTTSANPLADGTYTAQAEQKDAANNTGTSTPTTFSIDTTAPDTSIDSSPPPLDNSPTATFTFLASEPGSTFACELDGGGFSACTTPKSYSGLADGSHTFSVRATDPAGNTDPTPATFTWTIDTTPPQITLTQPANGTSTGPIPTFAGQAGTAPGDEPSVTIEVYAGATATGSPVRTYTATPDGSGAYTTAASPLADGTYTAQAEQEDTANNTGTSSPTTFSVSSTPPPTSTYRTDVLSDGPAAYWRLGEAAGTVAADETGTNNGAYQNGVTLGQAGVLTADANTAVSFDGVNDIVSVPHSSSLNATAGVTIEAWVKRSKSSSWQNILAKPGNGAVAAQNYALWLNTANKPVAYFGNGSSSISATAPAIDTNWHHIVATYDEATAKVYVDGILKASSNSSVQLTANSQPLLIGRTTDNNRIFGGTLDEVAVYPSALSAARIQAHYTAATSVDTTPPQVTLTAPPDGSVVTPTPTFAGQAGIAAGDLDTVTLRIYSGNTTGGQLVQTRTTSASAGSWSVDASPALADGIYTARAAQADSTGNLGLSQPTTFTVTSADITPPAVTLAAPVDGSSGNDHTPQYTGTAGTALGDLPTITVNVYLGLTPSGEPLQTFTTTATGGSWQIEGDTLPDGTYTARAEQSDDIGNLGLSAPHTFTIGAGYRDEILSDAPAAYWRLGETAGAVAADETGTNNGAFQNGVTLGQAGVLTADANTAVSFDGVNDIVSVPHSSSLNATAGVTIEAWIKRSKSSAWQNILAKPGNGAVATQNYALWLNTANQPVAYFGNGSSSISATAPAIDTNWHHIVATYDEATAKVYVDGILKASSNSSVQLTANSQPLLIGRTTDNNRIFGGTLDEVAVYRSALSAARIQTHYQRANALDTVAPIVTLSTPPDGSSTLDTRPHFAGVAEVTASASATITLKIFAGSSATGSPIQTLTTTRFTSGTWSVDASAPLALGTYTAQAEQADLSGNVGKSVPSTFTVAASFPSPLQLLAGAGDIADCTDTGVNQTANLILGLPTATVQTFGDNAYPHGSANDFANCYNPTWGQFKNRTNPAIGDHEYETPNASGYFNYFADRLAPFGASAQDPLRAYYSYDLGTWHVVVLNAICYEITGCSVNGQVAWLNADLDAHTNTCTLAVLAAPRWSSGSVHGSNQQMQAYWDSFYANRVDLVVGGDDHVYERFAPQDPQGFYAPGRGVRQFTVGTGGGSLYTFLDPKANSEVRYRNSYGILRLGLHATSYDWRFLPTSGTFTDSGSDSCS